MNSLAKKAGVGVFWNIVAQFVQQLVRFFVTVILARLLSPDDFGLFALVLVFIEFFQPVREWGFQAALIQKESLDEGDLSTAFWSICIIGLVLYFFTVLSARSVGSFMNNRQIGEILPVIGVSFLLTPFGSIQWSILNKELNFKSLALRDTIATIVYGVTACLMAVKGFGVLSLVIAYLAREVTFSIIFSFVYKWKPHFLFNYSKLKAMVKFSLNCMGSGLINNLIANVDNIFVGKILGTRSLGFYSLSHNTVSHPQTKFVAQISKVLFPVYSLMQNNPDKMREAYLKSLSVVSLVTVPMLSVLFASADIFVSIFYGHKWLPAVPLIRIMCFYGLARAFISINSSIFLSKGRSDIDFKITLFRLIIIIPALFLGVRYGVVGVSVAVLVYSIINLIISFYFVCGLLEVDFGSVFMFQARSILFASGIVEATFLFDLFTRRFIVLPNFLALTVNFLLGFAVSLMLFFCFSRKELNYAVALLRNMLRRS